MSQSPRRGEIWSIDAGITVLVISSTVYNEIPNEPTVIVVPCGRRPDTGFGVDLGAGWAAPGLVTSLRKARLGELRRRIDVPSPHRRQQHALQNPRHPDR